VLCARRELERETELQHPLQHCLSTRRHTPAGPKCSGLISGPYPLLHVGGHSTPSGPRGEQSLGVCVCVCVYIHTRGRIHTELASISVSQD
jgi:hypothetical protein